MTGVKSFMQHRRRSTESPDGTDIFTVGPSINASPTPGSAGTGNIFTLTAGAQIALNGTVLGGSAVTEIYYLNHTAYQKGGGLWWGPMTASSTGAGPIADPHPITVGAGLFGVVNANGSWNTTRSAEYEAHITSATANPPTLMGQYFGGFSERFSDMLSSDPFGLIGQWNAAVAATNIKNAIPNIGLLLANAPFSSSTVSNQDYIDIANGVYDANYNAFFTAYKNAGFTKIYIRIAWEFQFGGGYPWLTNYGVANWLAAWRRVAELAHAFAGMTIRTVWNPSEDFGSSVNTPLQCYPSGVGLHGDYVDYIGLDHYADNGWAPLNTAANSFSASNACAFAVARNKPIIFAEVGGSELAPNGNQTITQFCTDFWTAVLNNPGVKLGGFVIWEENYGDNTGILKTATGGPALNGLVNHLVTLPGG